MIQTIVGRYEIIQSLGSGGFGETFLAKDTQMPSGKKVVVKRLKPINDNHVSMTLIQGLFEKEAKVLEELGQNSSQIPTLYAYFTEDQQFYLIQEYIKGKSLAELGVINTAQCESILSSLLNTLKYVHGNNIIHRDIKPENIIIRDSDRLPVLIDFGAVKESMGAVSLSSGSTVSSVIVGTRGFIPPEQSLGRTVFSSDLYALALTMIYSLTGKYPIEILSNQMTGELDWQSLIPNLSPNLKIVLEKATKMDISNRYLTAQAMYQALHNSEMETMAVVPSVNTIDLSKNVTSNSPATILIPNSEWNNPVSNIHQNSVNNPQKNNLIPLLITGILVALGVSGGFIITQQRAQTLAKLEEVEREKEEAEAKVLEEKQKREQEEAKRQESEKMRLEAEQARVKAEELRRQAEVRANNQPKTRTIVVNPSVNNSSSNSYASIGGKSGSKNIRSGPGTSYSVVGQGYTGETIEILETGYDQGGYRWYKVYHSPSGTTGWIAAQLINF
ncbi:serine/threonine kinase [Geminocystis sp. NIES-3708]|uniref:serine/threonine protein kinase n=1 Tax=Geminocystis sp. NIES-3708 TaxID=1615909 RepID=UPI0005FCCAD3|nr:serine/threonine protein kinase [Geminocystis sp. NIES-3708]BAQ60100.1 serine/threonine kinase [Geminocystis sp. NIES-3708]